MVFRVGLLGVGTAVVAARSIESYLYEVPITESLIVLRGE